MHDYVKTLQLNIVYVLESENRLWVQLGTYFNLSQYVSPLCKKAGNNLSVQVRLSSFMSFKQRRIPLKIFIEAQFWILHSNMDVQ